MNLIWQTKFLEVREFDHSKYAKAKEKFLEFLDVFLILLEHLTLIFLDTFFLIFFTGLYYLGILVSKFLEANGPWVVAINNVVPFFCFIAVGISKSCESKLIQKSLSLLYFNFLITLSIDFLKYVVFSSIGSVTFLDYNIAQLPVEYSNYFACIEYTRLSYMYITILVSIFIIKWLSTKDEDRLYKKKIILCIFALNFCLFELYMYVEILTDENLLFTYVFYLYSLLFACIASKNIFIMLRFFIYFLFFVFSIYTLLSLSLELEIIEEIYELFRLELLEDWFDELLDDLLKELLDYFLDD